MKAVKENTGKAMDVSKKNESDSNFTVEKAIVLGQSINSLSRSCPTMPGKLLYALGKNERMIEKYVADFRNTQMDLLLELAEQEDGGKIKIRSQEEIVEGANPFVFKSDDAQQKYEAEMDKKLKESIKIDFFKVDKNIFFELNVPASQNTAFTYLVDTLGF